jgi:hypothetical protein
MQTNGGEYPPQQGLSAFSNPVKRYITTKLVDCLKFKSMENQSKINAIINLRIKLKLLGEPY